MCYYLVVTAVTAIIKAEVGVMMTEVEGGRIRVFLGGAEGCSWPGDGISSTHWCQYCSLLHLMVTIAHLRPTFLRCKSKKGGGEDFSWSKLTTMNVRNEPEATIPTLTSCMCNVYYVGAAA